MKPRVCCAKKLSNWEEPIVAMKSSARPIDNNQAASASRSTPRHLDRSHTAQPKCTSSRPKAASLQTTSSRPQVRTQLKSTSSRPSRGVPGECTLLAGVQAKRSGETPVFRSCRRRCCCCCLWVRQGFSPGPLNWAPKTGASAPGVCLLSARAGHFNRHRASVFIPKIRPK